MEALADYRSPEGFQLLVVMLWMRLCILPHFRDLLNCWNLWSEEKSVTRTQASGMFQRIGPAGSYLSASTYELACTHSQSISQNGEPCVGSRIFLHKAPKFGFSIDSVSSSWADKRIVQCLCKCWQSPMDWQTRQNNNFLNMLFLGEWMFQILLLKVDFFFFFSKKKENMSMTL